MLDPRKDTLLKLIIEDYIQTAEPVGSKQLLVRHGLDVSSATIRNEMAFLEQEGFLRQPHTSAGRVPTEKAYLYYLQQLTSQGSPRVQPVTMHSAHEAEETFDESLRCIAKRLVELSGETAIVAGDHRFGYYIGVSNLLTKPDFNDLELLRTVSAMVDQFDEAVMHVYDRVQEETVVFIGSDNPFGHHMTTILVKYQIDGGPEGLLGLVGPLRMNYARNISLLNQARDVINTYDV